MERIKNYAKKHPVWMGGILFAAVALLMNIFWILVVGTAHMNDIVHAIPVILVYSPIIDLLGGLVPTDFIFVPFIMLMDGVVGMIVGAILGKFTKTENTYWVVLALVAAVYFIVITFQWLPII